MKRTLPLLFCLAHLLIPAPVISQQPSAAWRGKQKPHAPAVDALWISIIPSYRPPGPGVRAQYSYFDLQSDGRFVFAEGNEFSSMKVVRAGVLPEKLVRRAFHIVSKPSVLNADDTDPGEPIFSDSDWISIGLMVSGKVRARGGWAHQEEINDFPKEFQDLIKELRLVGAKLSQATRIKALLSADVVEEWRLKLIGRDRFIVLDEAALDNLPALKQALLMSRRMVAVEDETQMIRFADLARRFNPESKYWGLYKIGEQGFYEVGAYYLQR